MIEPFPGDGEGTGTGTGTGEEAREEGGVRGTRADLFCSILYTIYKTLQTIEKYDRNTLSK
jgi:hypothetical protein